MNEVVGRVEASQALYLSLQVVVKPGDEVILFEPFFDVYVNQIKLAGGTLVFVLLKFVPYLESDEGNKNGERVEVTGGTWIVEPENLKKGNLLKNPCNYTKFHRTIPLRKCTRLETEVIAKNVINSGPQCVFISNEVYK